MRATANGHSDIVKLLLEAGADTATMEDVRSMLPDTRLPYARKGGTSEPMNVTAFRMTSRMS